MQTARPLKVLIAGAGISGPAAAFWLARAGCHVTVLERNPTLRASGQQIDLTGQGILLARMMGIEPALRAAHCPEPGMRYIDSRGRSKAFFPVNINGKGLSQTRELEVMRGDVVRILYNATKDLDGVRYVFGSYIKGFTQEENGVGGVRVVLNDGKQENYDILIGADGIGSTTRQLLYGPLKPEHRRDLGVHLAFFTAPAREGDTHDWTVCHMPGGQILMTRRDKPENIRVYLATRTGTESLDAATTLEEKKAALVKMFANAPGWQMDRFLHDLQHAPEADDLYCQSMTQVRLPEGDWSKGRVVLLGDAAYCPAAIGGGIATTAALVGAYVLAGEIAAQWKAAEQDRIKFDLGKAARAYEGHIRPFITANTQVPPWVLRVWFPESSFGIAAMHTVAGLATTLRLDKLMGNGAEEKPTVLDYPDYFAKGSSA